MKLKGILDFSLGNFLCLRGFAPMGVLQDISEAPEDIQRKPKDGRLKEIGDYLRKGELVFFPEVILCACLHEGEVPSDLVAALYAHVQRGEPFRTGKFAGDLFVSSTVTKARKKEDIRAVQYFQVGTLSCGEKPSPLFARLDGNHRLSATKDSQVRERVTPFCLILCQTQTDYRRFSRSLFHNINHKQVPLPMEHNLRLIIEDEGLFPDDMLKKTAEGFGWPYYLTRKLHNRLDFELIPHLQPIFKDEPRTRILRVLDFLIDRDTLGANENSIKRLKEALVAVNALHDTHPALQGAANFGLLVACAYFHLDRNSKVPLITFIRWVLANHLHEIKESNPSDLVAIFQKIMVTRKRTIFVSMPFGKKETEDHYNCITEVVESITRNYPDFKPPLTVKRVDFHTEGVSYPIRAKIDDFMANCGLLLADLTFCNPNVYHEIGFMDGKAKGEAAEHPDVLMFLDESVPADAQAVGFNLRDSSQIRFTQIADFKIKLRTNLEQHFKLTS
jgi:hypothetical protein